MKKTLSPVLIVTLLFIITACSSTDKKNIIENGTSNNSTKISDNISNNSTTKKVKMRINGIEISVILNESPEAIALYNALPLELSFEDFGGSEKIAYLPEGKDIPITSSTEGYDPSIGDFGLFAPWGNLCIFYQDQSTAKGLIALGKIESGIDMISNINDGTIISLSKTN